MGQTFPRCLADLGDLEISPRAAARERRKTERRETESRERSTSTGSRGRLSGIQLMGGTAQGPELAGQGEFDQLHAVTAHTKSQLEDDRKRDQHKSSGATSAYLYRYSSFMRRRVAHARRSRLCDSTTSHMINDGSSNFYGAVIYISNMQHHHGTPNRPFQSWRRPHGCRPRAERRGPTRASASAPSRRAT